MADDLRARVRESDTQARSFFARNGRAWAVFGIGAIPVIGIGYAIGPNMGGVWNVQAVQTGQLVAATLGSAFTFVTSFVFFFLLRRYPDIALAVFGLILLFLVMIPGLGAGLTIIAHIFAALLGAAAALRTRRGPALKPTTFGSAEWASLDDIDAAGLTRGNGFALGAYRGPGEPALHYGGDRHLLTVAPTRAGKGVSAIIPNLLTYPGSALVIDPKGENAMITGAARRAMGQTVMLLDPWNLAAERMGVTAAKFNPLDWLQADDPDLAENVMLLADALVIPSGGDSRFWDEEAKGLIFGLLMYLATDERERPNRSLGRLRDLLTLPQGPSEDPDDFTQAELRIRMGTSGQPLVRSSGNRFFDKEDRERSSVLSSAQAQTHFLDSPRIRDSLSGSDFRFEDLKTLPLTVYLILPADRLNAFGRWLRLLIQQAITVNARNIGHKPTHSVLFMLDEMPALGHLSMVEQAYSLMAGFGMQLWGIVQDLSQLKRIYGDGWETFIGNSGVLQYFGSRDQMTAEYFSKLCGVTTVDTLSETIGRAITSTFGGGGSSSNNWSITSSNTGRSLAFPDELMTLAGNRQLLLVENHNPIAALKVPWFTDPKLKALGTDLQSLRAIEAPNTALQRVPDSQDGGNADPAPSDDLVPVS